MSKVAKCLAWGLILGTCLFSAPFVRADEGIPHLKGENHITKCFGSAKSFGKRTETYSSESFFLVLTDESSQRFSCLKLALDAHNNTNKTWLKEQEHEITSDIIPAMLQDSIGVLRALPFIRNIDFRLRRADSKVLSYMELVRTYDLGAHGYEACSGINFDVTTGKKIDFADVIKDKTHLADILEKKLLSIYPEAIFFGLKPALSSHVKKEDFSWTLDPQGITFYFNPYDLAPYAEGMLTVTILFKEYPQIFADNYKSVPDSYCIQLQNYTPLRCDLENDGIVDSLTVVPLDDKQCKIVFNTQTIIDRGDEHVYPVLVHTSNGQNYLYVNSLDDQDNRELHVYDLNTSLPEIVGKLPYTTREAKDDDPNVVSSETYHVLSDPDDFYLHKNDGTWAGSFRVSDSGLPVNKRD